MLFLLIISCIAYSIKWRDWEIPVFHHPTMRKSRPGSLNQVGFFSYSIERPPVVEYFAILIALLWQATILADHVICLPFQILLTIAGLHVLNMQSRMEQGCQFLVVPHNIPYVRRIPAVLEEEQKMIHMPDALQTPVLASRSAPTTGLRFSGFHYLVDPLV